ncbi:MAG: murein biosynthesis integral membrane protein MurJ [Actinobacteria bacterium]|nr:murein biosynthesis integral membrane protein MurJ [Actinomycetota bacterium]
MSEPQQPAPAGGGQVDPAGSRNSALVAAGILLSRISGLVRTAVIARFLGVSAVADAFQAAMRIPNLLQNLLGEGVLSASFIPVYSRLLAQGRDAEAGRVAGAIAGLLSTLTGVLALLGVVFAAPITRLVAIGFTGRTLELAITLTRILFPGVGFLVLSAWCLGVLNSHRRFFLSYVAPVIWNVTQVAVLVAAVVLIDGDVLSATPSTAVLEQLAIALAWGVLAGGVLQFAVQLPAVLRSAGPVRPSLDTRLAGVRGTLRAFWPVVTGRGVVQLMIYVDIALASLLAEGAVSALEYATRLVLLPISLFGMSAAASELPALSSLDTHERAGVARRLAPALARIAFFVVPTIAAFVVLGDLLYDVVLPPLPATLVWLVLLGSTVGLLSNTSSRLLQSALYASGDTRTPTRYAIMRVVVAALVGAALMLQFDRVVLTEAGYAVQGSLPAFTPLPPDVRGTDPTEALRLGAVGLALAAGASSWLEFGLLRRHLTRHRGIAVRLGGGQLQRTGLAGALAGAAGLVVRLLLADHPLPVLLPATGATIGLSYLALAAALRLPQIAEVRRVLPRRR